MSGEHVRHRVSLVLELWDDFSDRPLSDPSIEIIADGTIRPIRKADGFYVFVNCLLPLHVEIRSEQYETEEFDAGIQGEEAVIIKKRLRPGKNYPIPDGTTCIEGTLHPGIRIGAAVKDAASALRLFADYDPDADAAHLELFDPAGKNPEGKYFYIEDSSGDHSEIFRTVGYERTDKRLRIEPELQHAYKKAGTKVYEYRYTEVRRDGTFFLPLKVRSQGKKVICQIRTAEKDFCRKIEPGIVNRIDFDEK